MPRSLVICAGVGVELAEDPQQRGGRVVGPERARRRGVAGEAVEVVALVGREAQRAGQRGGRRLRRPVAAALLQPRVEVGRHVRQPRDLLAAQAAGPAPLPGRQPDVVGGERRAAAAQEVRERVLVHRPHDATTAAAHPGTACPPTSPPLLRAAAARATWMDMTSTTPRIALITGGNRGIGRSAALHLADAGSGVVITYNSHADEAEQVVAELRSQGRAGRRAAAAPGRRRRVPGVRAAARRDAARDLRARPLRPPRPQRRLLARRQHRDDHDRGLRRPRRRPPQGPAVPHARRWRRGSPTAARSSRCRAASRASRSPSA